MVERRRVYWKSQARFPIIEYYKIVIEYYKDVGKFICSIFIIFGSQITYIFFFYILYSYSYKFKIRETLLKFQNGKKNQ